jgi:hypothetical protein
VIERGAQVVDELRVPGQDVRTVEDDAHGGAVWIEHRLTPDPPRRDVLGRREAERGAEHAIGDEPQQVLEVGEPAARQELERPCHDVGRDRRGRRQLGVGHHLAAEGEQRDALLGAGAAQVVERSLPRAPAPEEAHEHDLHAVEARRLLERSRVRRPHGWKPGREPFQHCAQAEDLSVGVGEDEDHAAAPSMSASTASTSRWA